ncbi:MAG: hypothetical protein Q9187_004099 [Circinaria calcarea]
MNGTSSHGHIKSSPSIQSSCDPSPLSRDSTSIFDGTSSTILEPPKALTSTSPFASAQTSPQRPSSRSSSKLQHPYIETDVHGRQSSPLPTQYGDSALEDQQNSVIQIPPSLVSKSITFNSSSQQSSVPSSPSKEKWSFVSDFSEIQPSEARSSQKGGILADWFRGESNPISIGLIPSPTKEKTDPLENMMPQTAALHFGLAQSKSATKPPAKSSASNLSRFSFFGAKTSPISATKPQGDDELAQLDIKTALLPGGQMDPFSPSSFKNLLQNAEGLLSRLQTAYKQRTATLQEVIAEKEAQSEELIEAQTRAKYLKLQLDDLSAKLAEQDEAVMSMVNELAQEKQARQEDEQARKRTIRVVDATTEVRRISSRRSKDRMSRASTVSDSGFESDGDSLFSKEHDSSSPTTTSTPTSSIHSPVTSQHSKFAPFQKPQSEAKLTQAVPIETEVGSVHLLESTVAPVAKNTAKRSSLNSEVVHSSEAWGVVDILKEENKGLKERVGHLEGALDGCLELVHGLTF